MKTQELCRQRFLRSIDRFIDKLDAIDQSTPAEPGQSNPPDWWHTMSALRRHLHALKEQEQK